LGAAVGIRGLQVLNVHTGQLGATIDLVTLIQVDAGQHDGGYVVGQERDECGKHDVPHVAIRTDVRPGEDGNRRTSDSSNVMAGNTRPGHLLSIFESLICNMMKPMQMAMRNTKNTTANIVAPIMITLLA